MENKELIYNNEKLVGKNISKLIKREGYTKLSFAKKTGISRPTLNKILDGDIPSSTTLESHINKIIEILNIDIEALLQNDYEEAQQNTVSVVCNDKESQDYHRSGFVNDKLDLLDGILDLCEIYIKE